METAATPMLRQYQQLKANHPNCILFFRLGDFYEMFFEDAKDASSILDLVLTSRGHDSTGKIPMCGVPYHSADNYIAKLVKAGRKVAICEQMEDPAAAKGIVKRDVIRVITAGTYLDDSSDSRYLMALAPLKSGAIGFAFCDTSGGTIRTNVAAQVSQAVELLSKLPIYECIFPESSQDDLDELFHHPLLKAKNISRTPYQDWCFNADLAKKEICQHWGVLNLNGFGIESLPEAQAASGALLEYLRAMTKTPIKHIDRISLYANDEYVFISPAAHYGLELETLLQSIDLTQTPMGRRMFRFWVYHPLKHMPTIVERQTAVAAFSEQWSRAEKFAELLRNMPDLSKALSRLSCGCSSVKDLVALRQGLLRGPLMAEALQPLQHPLLHVTDLPQLRETLTKTIDPEVPLSKPEGKIIRPGIDAELDDLRTIQERGRQWLAEFQAREIKRTGISSLKVGFNNVFGYYIEITKTHQKSAPPDYIRKQTLVNGERYITGELKEYEEKILTAQDKILAIEKRLLSGLHAQILEETSRIHAFCDDIATADCLWSLAQLGQRHSFILPTVNETETIDIKDGRHPVVDQSVETFTPNDTLLDTNENQLLILTGPNMAGKSTFIRQTALLVIMSQMGAPIPASSAVIGIVDKIFTRIGAHDEIARGISTFMVEMTECAHILNNITPRSLVILDEVGRGTSTSDGLSLAWALAEHMHKQKARTLFATHFHELTALANQAQGIKNYNVAVKEWKDKIIFMHKIVPGGSDDSYGIYVAKLAGLPDSVIKRSKEILCELELGAPNPYRRRESQLSLFAPAAQPDLEAVRAKLQDIDINNITPMDALQKLSEIKNQLST